MKYADAMASNTQLHHNYNYAMLTFSFAHYHILLPNIIKRSTEGLSLFSTFESVDGVSVGKTTHYS